MDITRLRRPRCFLVYALAPDELSPREANRIFNSFIADRRLPLPVFHDHFLGRPGGIAVFYASTDEEREALTEGELLEGWKVEIRPLIYARSPAGFDEQTRFTLRAYRGLSWDRVRVEDRPTYGDPDREVDTGREDTPEG